MESLLHRLNFPQRRPPVRHRQARPQVIPKFLQQIVGPLPGIWSRCARMNLVKPRILEILHTVR